MTWYWKNTRSNLGLRLAQRLMLNVDLDFGKSILEKSCHESSNSLHGTSRIICEKNVFLGPNADATMYSRYHWAAISSCEDPWLDNLNSRSIVLSVPMKMLNIYQNLKFWIPTCFEPFMPPKWRLVKAESKLNSVMEILLPQEFSPISWDFQVPLGIFFGRGYLNFLSSLFVGGGVIKACLHREWLLVQRNSFVYVFKAVQVPILISPYSFQQDHKVNNDNPNVSKLNELVNTLYTPGAIQSKNQNLNPDWSQAYPIWN